MRFRADSWTGRISVLALAIALIDGAVCGDVHAAPARAAKLATGEATSLKSPGPRISVSPGELVEALPDGIAKVEEFRFIRQLADELGIRVYLYGGAASAVTHYRRWDLERAKGSTRLPDEVFAYDIEDIFRPGQDIDLALDGEPAKFDEFKRKLEQRYPRSSELGRWEPRPLRVPVGTQGASDYHPALLKDRDFSLQNNDTGSIGAVEITDPPRGEPRVRDLTAWDSKKSRFLDDAAIGKISFLRNPEHATTARARAGDNPEILGVIRYLTKISQYNLEPSAADLKTVKTIVKETDPKALAGGYTKYWLDRYAIKLIDQSTDLEKTYKLLKETGAGAVLQAVPGINSRLSELLDKKPLPSFEVGTGSGKTARDVARERGRRTLEAAHDSRELSAMESIMGGHFSRPNAFVSRPGSVKETASQGEGFYARLGEVGAWANGYTTRFEILPEARLGTDFVIDHGDDIRLLNAAAARVIPDPAAFSDPVQYFRRLKEVSRASGPTASLEMTQMTRQGRHVGKLLPKLGAESLMEIRSSVFSEPINPAVLDRWLHLVSPVSSERQYLFSVIAGKSGDRPDLDRRNKLLAVILDRPDWTSQSDRGELLAAFDRLIADTQSSHRGTLVSQLVEKFLKGPGVLESEAGLRLVRMAVETGHGRDLVPELLAARKLPDREALLSRAIKDLPGFRSWREHRDAAMALLKDPLAKRHPEWVYFAGKSMARAGQPEEEAENLEVFRTFLKKDPHWSKQPSVQNWIRSSVLTLNTIQNDAKTAEEIPATKDPAKLLRSVSERGNSFILSEPELRRLDSLFSADTKELSASRVKELRELLEANLYSDTLREAWLRSPLSELPEFADLTQKFVDAPLWETYLGRHNIFGHDVNPGFERRNRWIIKAGSRAAVSNAVQELLYLKSGHPGSGDFSALLAEARSALEHRNFDVPVRVADVAKSGVTSPYVATVPPGRPAAQPAAGKATAGAEPGAPLSDAGSKAVAAKASNRSVSEEVAALDAQGIVKFLRSASGQKAVSENPELFGQITRKFVPALHGPDPVGAALITEVMNRDFAKSHPEWVEELRNRRNAEFLSAFRTQVLHSPEWKKALGKNPQTVVPPAVPTVTPVRTQTAAPAPAPAPQPVRSLLADLESGRVKSEDVYRDLLRALDQGAVTPTEWDFMKSYLEGTKKLDLYGYRAHLSKVDTLLRLAADPRAPKDFAALAFERADTIYNDPAFAQLKRLRQAEFEGIRARLGASAVAGTRPVIPRVPRNAKTLEQIKQSPNAIQRQFDIGEFGRWYMSAMRNPSEADEAVAELNGLVRYLETLPPLEKSDAAETLLQTFVQQRSMDDLEKARRLKATKVGGVETFVTGIEKQVLQDNLRGQPAGFTAALESLMRQHIDTPRDTIFDCAAGYSRFR